MGPWAARIDRNAALRQREGGGVERAAKNLRALRAAQREGRGEAAQLRLGHAKPVARQEGGGVIGGEGFAEFYFGNESLRVAEQQVRRGFGGGGARGPAA